MHVITSDSKNHALFINTLKEHDKKDSTNNDTSRLHFATQKIIFRLFFSNQFVLVCKFIPLGLL